MIQMRWQETERCDGPYVRVGGARTYKLQMRWCPCVTIKAGRIAWNDLGASEWEDVPVEAIPVVPVALPMDDEVRSLS